MGHSKNLVMGGGGGGGEEALRVTFNKTTEKAANFVESSISQPGFPWTPPSDVDHFIFRIEYNHIHHYGMGILNDFGGVYVSAKVACWSPTPSNKFVDLPPYRNPSDEWQSGPSSLEGSVTVSCNMATLIRQNVMHDAECYNYGADGVYTGEAAAGVDAVQNLVYDIDAAGIHFHCGVNLTSRNNFVIFSDRRGQKGALSACNMGGFSIRVPVHFQFDRNILYVGGNQSHLVVADSFIDNSTFDENVYFSDSKPLVFFENVDFDQWQKEGNVSSS